MTESDRHHVPPRKPDPNPRFIKRKNARHHRAYHLLFAAAKTYDDACLILWHDWWEQAKDDLVCQYPDASSLAEAPRHRFGMGADKKTEKPQGSQSAFAT